MLLEVVFERFAAHCLDYEREPIVTGAVSEPRAGLAAKPKRSRSDTSVPLWPRSTKVRKARMPHAIKGISVSHVCASGVSALRSVSNIAARSGKGYLFGAVRVWHRSYPEGVGNLEDCRVVRIIRKAYRSTAVSAL